MKYSEFREYLKGTNFEANEDSLKIQVNIDDIMYVRISKIAYRKIILPFSVEEPEEFELIKKSLELAETPLDEREEKYYLKYRIIDNWEADKYVNCVEVGENYLILSGRRRNYKTKFTRKEIEKIKKIFNTDLNNFEIIEAEEDQNEI